MNEIELEIDGQYAIEYSSSFVPRVGEHIDIAHKRFTGLLEITDVCQRVFEMKYKHDEIRTYVKIKSRSL